MISLTLRLLLERRQELQELFEQVKFDPSITCTAHGTASLQNIVKSAQQIVKEWPEEYWPLEDEENIWPDKSDVLDYLQNNLDKLAAYNSGYELENFHEWIPLKLDLYGILYFFRKQETENDLEDEVE